MEDVNKGVPAPATEAPRRPTYNPTKLAEIIEATPLCIFCGEEFPFRTPFGWTYGCRRCGAI